MAFIFKVAETNLTSSVWMVLQNNGIYYTSTNSGADGTWTVNTFTEWAFGINQKEQIWSRPSNIAHSGSLWAINKPAGHHTLSPYKQYAYFQGELPSGDWNKQNPVTVSTVVYNTDNEKFQRFFVNSGDIVYRNSTDAVSFDAANSTFSNNNIGMISGVTVNDAGVMVVAAEHNDDNTSDKAKRIYVNSGSLLHAETFQATITGGATIIKKPVYANNIWFAGCSGGFIKSTDGAENWSKISVTDSDGYGVNLYHAVYNSDHWIAVGGNANSDGVIFRSDDNLATLDHVRTCTETTNLYVVHSDNSNVYLAGGDDQSVYRSMNYGTTWTGPIGDIFNDTTDAPGSAHNDNDQIISMIYGDNFNT
jgi:hypothetical protein